jgi:hypothetical protein
VPGGLLDLVASAPKHVSVTYGRAQSLAARDSDGASPPARRPGESAHGGNTARGLSGAAYRLAAVRDPRSRQPGRSAPNTPRTPSAPGPHRRAVAEHR